MKLRYVAVILVVLIFALGYIGIVHVNNRIAQGLEERLLEFPLPPETELLDSKAIAGKLSGNGNGMQYRGMLLLSSYLSEEELFAHYSELSDGDLFVLVYPQKSQMIDEYYDDYWFEYWDSTKPNWRIELFSNSIVGFEETIQESILNLDLRGH